MHPDIRYYVVYAEGKIYCSDSNKLPDPRGVQVIVQEHRDVGWRTQSGYDYYVWREEQGRYVGVDLFGLFDYLLDRGDILFGRTLPQSEFNEAMKLALEILDGEKQGKTGWLPGERKPDG